MTNDVIGTLRKRVHTKKDELRDALAKIKDPVQRARYEAAVQGTEWFLTEIDSVLSDVKPVPLEDIDVPIKHKFSPNDGETSWQAAASQTKSKSLHVYTELLSAYERHGDMNDDEMRHKIADFLAEHGYAPETVTNRRNDLVKSGWVEWKGYRRVGDSGSPMNVWGLAPAAKKS